MEGGEQITAISAPQGDAGRRRGLSLRHRTACSWSFAPGRPCGPGGAASKKRGLRRPPGPPPGWPGVCGPRGGVSKSPRFRPLRGAAGKSGGPSLRPAQPVAGPSPPAASTSRPAPLRKGAGLAAPRATAWVARGVWPRGHTPPGHTPPGRRVPPRCRMRTGSRSGFSGRQGRRTGSCSLCHTKKRAALGVRAGGRRFSAIVYTACTFGQASSMPAWTSIRWKSCKSSSFSRTAWGAVLRLRQKAAK